MVSSAMYPLYSAETMRAKLMGAKEAAYNAAHQILANADQQQVPCWQILEMVQAPQGPSLQDAWSSSLGEKHTSNSLEWTP